ncbi:MAG TPA: AhpC/TSA family protein [Candidatus Dormibacteraeota bacterium]|nr:AhpC/TSA family protein [Candidatus Dormibacteraeota bacterium]
MRDSDSTLTNDRVYIVVAADAATTSELCDSYGVNAHCIADPERNTHRAARLRRASLLTFFSGDFIKRAIANRKAGFRQNWGKARVDDLGRVPGAMRIAADGRVAWIHRGTHAGDLPPIAELLAR